MQLSKQSCVACKADAPSVTDEELSVLLEEIPGWTVISSEGIPQLERVFKFGNFVSALGFAQRVGELAEQENHHPKLVVEWGRVSVCWWTHKIRGLHQSDFICAAKTDVLFQGLKIS